MVELVIGDIICLMRRIPAHTHHMKHGMWDKSASGSHEVRGKTLGIIGYGNIGSQLSVIAEALGMRVVFYDIEEKLAMGNAHRCSTLNELLEQSDVVTLHVDGRKSNTGFFGEDQFAHMKQDSIFINLSRGFVADLDALKKHLDSGHISGAAVDVFPVEPKKSGDEFLTSLADEDNMILTPHIGGSTLEAQKSIGQFVSQRLEDYWFRGSTMLSVNLPQITLSDIRSNFRIAHLHANLPGVLAKVNRVLGEENINIAAQALGHRRRNRLCGHRCGPAPQPEGFGRTRSHRRHDPYACDQLTIPIRQTPLRYECIVGVPITYWLEPPQCMNPNAVCRNRPVLRYQVHFSQNKRIIICVRNRSNLLQRIGLQLVDRVLEILKILKILVYTGESHIRDLIKITQRFQNGPADLVGFDLSQSSGTKILFDLLAKSLQIVFLDRTALACLATPEITLFLSNCSALPERFTTNNIVVSSVVKRLEHFGHSRLRRMEWPSSLMRVSTTLVSGF